MIPSEDFIRNVLWTTPIIDNHARPLLKVDHLNKHPLPIIAAGANGGALDDSHTTFSRVQAINQLAKKLDCEHTKEAVEFSVNKRRKDYDGWTRECLSGIQCILMEDEVECIEEAHKYRYFDNYTPSRSKRVLTIEHETAKLIDTACLQAHTVEHAFGLVIRGLEKIVDHAILDEEVVGFTSVVCYRTGLDIGPRPDEVAALAAFDRIYNTRRLPDATNVTKDEKDLNNFFLHLLAVRISGCEPLKKPIQFHTGLGHLESTITKASPAHLQDFIRQYPSVPLVLLHSGWPFARQSWHLSSMYGNVYSDIGGVIPFLSRDRQEGVVKEALELCPWHKILWSTRGQRFPETYLMAVTQMREALTTVIAGYIDHGDMSRAQARQLVEGLLFNNANKLYNLGLTPLPPHGGEDTDEQNKSGELQLLTEYLAGRAAPKYLRLYWVDYCSIVRCRIIPMRHIWTTLEKGDQLSYSVSTVIFGVLANDTLIPGVAAIEAYDLYPDMTSALAGPRTGHLAAMGWFRESESGSEVDLCPRTLLKRAVLQASNQGLEFQIGFEIEFVLLKRMESGDMEPLSIAGHCYSSSNTMDHDVAVDIVEEAMNQLEAAGIDAEMVHAESAGGQFEIILAKASPLNAIDTLIHARQIIGACATKKGYKMTLHPKPSATAPGTASHAHVSFTQGGQEAPRELYEAFYASILGHLGSLCAFTYSNVASYERVVDGFWAGGTWVAWGTENRETPLRKIKGSHWEVKCIDGLANPYLAFAAIIQCGRSGIAQGSTLTWGDCRNDPAKLSDAERLELSITQRIPARLEDALQALREDGDLGQLLGREFVQRYVAVKEAEMEMLHGFDETERRRWILQRY
jgi:glutamine synthetase